MKQKKRLRGRVKGMGNSESERQKEDWGREKKKRDWEMQKAKRTCSSSLRVLRMLLKTGGLCLNIVANNCLLASRISCALIVCLVIASFWGQHLAPTPSTMPRYGLILTLMPTPNGMPLIASFPYFMVNIIYWKKERSLTLGSSVLASNTFKPIVLSFVCINSIGSITSNIQPMYSNNVFWKDMHRFFVK